MIKDKDKLRRDFRAGNAVVVEIPARPITGNRLLRLHWAKRSGVGRLWETLVLAYLGSGPFKNGAMVGRRVDMLLSIERVRKQDADNLALSCKPVVDALKKAGWIKDDSERWFTCRYQEVSGARSLLTVTMKLFA